MHETEDTLGALADIFTWVGFGAAVVCGILALVLRLIDGTWLPVRAVVESVDGHHVVRWFDAGGGIHEAPLSAHDLSRLGGRDMVDIFARRGWSNRMRLTAGSPAVRLTVWLTVGLAAVGLLALVGSWVLLAVSG